MMPDRRLSKIQFTGSNTTHKNVILASVLDAWPNAAGRRLYVILCGSLTVWKLMATCARRANSPLAGASRAQHPCERRFALSIYLLWPPENFFLDIYASACEVQSRQAEIWICKFCERMATCDESPVHGPGRPEWRTCWRHICAVRAR
jgi:hypothetical protein